tara:strand:+ start:40 stop:552 length:513 start_codon:yes stop_codon:yes gene_type:complete
MTDKVITVFGDELFPKSGFGLPLSRRQRSTENIVAFLNGMLPDLVYIIPTAGTCVYFAYLCKILKVPYILISPYPGFFDMMNKLDKVCMEDVLSGAKSIIILNEEEPEDKEWVWDEAVEFASSVSSVVAFLYSENTSVKYQEFINKYAEKYNTEKLLLELTYDSREVPFK